MRKRGLEKQLILVGINRRMAENQYRREKVKTDDVLVTHAKKIRGFDREASRIRAGMSRCDVKMRDLARGVDMAEETEIEEETDEVLDAVTDRAMDRDPYERASQRERFRTTAADFEEERAEDAVEEEEPSAWSGLAAAARGAQPEREGAGARERGHQAHRAAAQGPGYSGPPAGRRCGHGLGPDPERGGSSRRAYAGAASKVTRSPDR